MRVSYIAVTSLVLVACGARTGLPTGLGDEPGTGATGNGTGSTSSGASGSGGAGVAGTGVGGTAIGGSLLEPLACSADTTSPPAPERSAATFWQFEAAEPGMLQNVGQGLHVTPNGRVLVTGQFDGTLVFRDSFGDSMLVSQGAQDVFVLCLEPDGSHGWSRAFGTASTDRGADITTDSQGNVYVVGETGASGNQVDFGAGPVTVNGVPQMFLVSYSAQGSYRWAKLFGGPYGSSRALRVAVDASDDVYLAGYVASLADFGGGAIDHQGEPDGFVASFGSDGDYRWDRTFGGSGYVLGAGLAVAPNGNVYFGGWFWGSADLGSGVVSTQNEAADAFLIALDDQGDLRWSKQFGRLGVDNIEAVCVDPNENVYVAGDLEGSLAYDGASIWAASFDASGQERWSHELDAEGINIGYDCVATDDGVVIGGIFEGCVSFGAGGRKPHGYGGFVFELAGDGTPRGSLILDGAGADYVQALAISEDKSTVFATGVMGTSFEDPSPMYLEVGTGDIFVATLAR